MHKSLLITEEDKNRILGLHETATKRQYLSEATEYDYAKGRAEETDKGGSNKIISATKGLGTDIEMLLQGFQEIKNFKETEDQLKRIWSNLSPNMRYSDIQDMLRGEMEGDNIDDIGKIIPILKNLGYSLSYKPFSTGQGMDPKTITITKNTGASNNQKTGATPTPAPEKTNKTQTNSGGYKQYVNDDIVKQIQNILVLKGYNVGKFGVDGKLGPDTANAILKALQNAQIPEEIRAKEEKPEQQQNVGPITPTQQQPNYTKLPS